MKILYFIDTMHGGGAARLLAILANALAKKNYSIVLATNTYNTNAYQLDSTIKIISLYPEDNKKKNRIIRFLYLLRRSRQITRNEAPDVIVTMLPPVSFFVKIATLGLKVPIVFCDVTSYARKDSPFVHFVRYYFYNLADAVTVQTQNDINILGKRIPRKVMISNPLAYPIEKTRTNRGNSILAIGHTCEWEIKGFDLLIRAFSIVKQRYPDCTLKIAGGTTPDALDYLSGLMHQYGVSDGIYFVGFQSHIDELMRQSAIFALPSRIEGFSLSLIEAISQGCACVSFKIHGVIEDVSGGGEGTLLVNDGDVNDFAENICRLLDDSELRAQVISDGQKYIERYCVESIVCKWEDLFKTLVDEK